MSSASKSAILEIKNISFAYENTKTFINNLSFSVGEGEFVGLLGANGSGKSTILKLSSGILQPLSGEIALWGKPIHSYKNRDRAKLICYLPQMLDANVPFTVMELVSMGLYPYEIPPTLNAEDALEAAGLKDKADTLLSDLSGGEKRRAYIAMTLLQGAGLLLFDEPLANLDIKYQIELVKLLRKLKEERNISVVMALHDINIALQFEKVMVIKEGKALDIGRPETVLNNEMIRKAFDVDVEVRKTDEGTYISYGNNL